MLFRRHSCYSVGKPYAAVTVNPTGTSRTVLAGVDAPIPPGKSEVTFIVTAFKDSLDLGALKLRGFKAVPSLDDIEQRFKPFSARGSFYIIRIGCSRIRSTACVIKRESPDV